MCLSVIKYRDLVRYSLYMFICLETIQERGPNMNKTGPMSILISRIRTLIHTNNLCPIYTDFISNAYNGGNACL